MRCLRADYCLCFECAGFPKEEHKRGKPKNAFIKHSGGRNRWVEGWQIMHDGRSILVHYFRADGKEQKRWFNADRVYVTKEAGQAAEKARQEAKWTELRRANQYSTRAGWFFWLGAEAECLTYT